MKDLTEYLKRRTIQEGDCWMWDGATNPSGAPVMRVKRDDGTKYTTGVRSLIAKTRGDDVRPGRYATYSCGCKECVNPNHVVMVTRRTLQKRTASSGVLQNPVRVKKLTDQARARGKITMEIARAIRADHGQKTRILADKYGVSQSVISAVQRHRTWKEPGIFRGLYEQT